MKVSWKVVITTGLGVHAVSKFIAVKSKREGLAKIADWRKTSNNADDSAQLRRNGVVVS